MRREIEAPWGATVADTFGMSDVWSTMAGECGHGDGLHLTTGGHALLEVVDPESGEPVALEDGARGELVWTHLRREASPLLRYRSGDLATRLDRPLRVRAHDAAHPHRRPHRRHAARAGRQRLPRRDRRRARGARRLGRHAIVADGDPIVPPLRVYVEARGRRARRRASRPSSTRACAARFEVDPLAPGTLPVAEHKTRMVYRTARGDELPRSHRDRRTDP